MTQTDGTNNLGAMTTQTEYDDTPLEELQEIVELLSNQLRSAKQVLREKRLAGVIAALATRREADAELAEELRKLGHPATRLHQLIPIDNLSTTFRNLHRLTDFRF